MKYYTTKLYSLSYHQYQYYIIVSSYVRIKRMYSKAVRQKSNRYDKWLKILNVECDFFFSFFF